MSNRIYNAFGYLWRFNLEGDLSSLPRWILLPTISVFSQQIEKAGHDIMYWNIDFMWLKTVVTLEIEQLNLGKKEYDT